MAPDLLKYFCITLFILVWFYICGILILRILKVNVPSADFNVFLNLLIGIISHVVIYAVCKTGFATLNVILTGILFVIWFQYYRKNRNTIVPPLAFKFHLKQLFELFCVALAFSLIRIGNVIEPAIYPYFHASRDDMFYSNVSYFISHYGVESFYLDWSSKTNSLGLIPYHYFELWLNALISDVTGQLNLVVYYFITSLLITILFYLSLLMIMSELLKVKLRAHHKALAFAMMFIGDLFFGLLSNQAVPNLTVGFSLYDNHKMLLVFIVCAFAWKAWKQEQIFISFLVLLIIPVFNYGLMPVIIGTVPVFFIVHRWILKTPEVIPYRKILFSYVVYLIALLSIQRVFPNKFQGVTTLGLKELTAYYNNFSKIKTVANYVLNYLMTLVMIALPYLFLLIPLKKQNLLNLKSGFSFMMIMFLGSAVFLSAILHFLMDTSQLFIITLNVTTHLFLFCAFPILLYKVKKNYIYKSLIIIFLTSGLYMLARKSIHKGSRIDRYSIEFLKKVQGVAGKIHGQGIRYLPPTYYNSVYNINPNCNYEGFYLSFFRNDIVIHTVTIDQIPDKIELHDFFNYNKNIILKSSYYLNSFNKIELDTASKENLQLIFIKNNNIDFIVATKDAKIPERINNLVTEQINDTLSGEKLMLIDRKRLN